MIVGEGEFAPVLDLGAIAGGGNTFQDTKSFEFPDEIVIDIGGIHFSSALGCEVKTQDLGASQVEDAFPGTKIAFVKGDPVFEGPPVVNGNHQIMQGPANVAFGQQFEP
jgi:hypothetical protein